MLKRTATYHEFLDDRGRRFVVRLCEGMAVGIVAFGPLTDRFEWRRDWGRYSPLSTITAERLVAEFCRKHLRDDVLDAINAELLATRSQEPVASSRDACRCAGDRQLPAGDRA
jgi:hypothetical protein